MSRLAGSRAQVVGSAGRDSLYFDGVKALSRTVETVFFLKGISRKFTMETLYPNFLLANLLRGARDTLDYEAVRFVETKKFKDTLMIE